MSRLPLIKQLILAALLAPVACAAVAQAISEEDADRLETFTLPVLGAAGRATVLSPNMRSTEASIDQNTTAMLIPGCAQFESGTFLCGSLNEYQHCRTLMISGMVQSCRAGVAFAGGFAEPREAAAGDYSLEVESDARVRVSRDGRGFGQVRGEAEVVIRFDRPEDVDRSWCVQRDPYIYFPTGPKGGSSELGESAGCEEPIEFSFEAHEDDLLRAYFLCEGFGLWGEEIEDSIEVLAASMFQIRSANPEFVSRYPDGSAVIAPYVTVEAPLTIDCRD